MKLKKGELKIAIIALLFVIVFMALLVWSFVKNGSECDEAMGYTCSVYEIDNHNWKNK